LVYIISENAIAGWRVVVLPDIFEGFGQGLEFGGVADMAGVAGELVVVVLYGEGRDEVSLARTQWCVLSRITLGLRQGSRNPRTGRSLGSRSAR